MIPDQQPDVPQEPTLANLFALHGEQVVDGLRTTLPGQIVDYDPEIQQASVQILIKHGYVDELGERQADTLPVIHNCPVVFWGPARGRITWPCAIGDTCVVWFASSSIAMWVEQGGLIDPQDDRRHDISDAFCQVGGHDFAHVPTDAPTDAVVVHCDKIQLGDSSANQPAVNQSALDTFVAALVTAIAAMTLSGDPAVSALAALKAALCSSGLPGSWAAGSTTTFIK